MMKILTLSFILFLVFPIKGAAPEGIISISKTALNNIIKASIAGIGNKDLEVYQIKNYSTSIVNYQAVFFNSSYQQRSLESAQVQLELMSSYNVIQVLMTNLTGSSKTYIEYDEYSTKGICTANLNYQDGKGSFFVRILKDPNERPTIQITGNLNIETEKMQITLFECDSLSNQDYLKTQLSNVFYNIDLPVYLEAMLQKVMYAINIKFSEVPQDYKIYKTIFEHYSLIEDPSMQNDYLISKIDSYSYNKKNSTINKDIDSNYIPMQNSSNPKDVQLFLAQTFFQNIIDTNYDANLLSYNFMINFLGKIFNLNCIAIRSPSFIIMNNITLNGPAQCNISYKTPKGPIIFPISFDAFYDVNMDLVKSTIYFSFNDKTSRISNITFLSPIPTELLWLKSIINSIFVPMINGAIKNVLKKNGIPLPRVASIPYLNTEKHYQTNYVEMDFNIFS